MVFELVQPSNNTKSLPIGAGKDALALKTDPHYTRSEIADMAKREKIIHLDDLILRRTLLGYLRQLTRSLLEELANALGESLGWDGEQKKAEVERAIKILAESHGGPVVKHLSKVVNIRLEQEK